VRYSEILVLVDISSFLTGAIIASVVRFGGLSSGLTREGRAPFLAVALVGATGWAVILAGAGAYSRRNIGSGPGEWRAVCDSAVRFLALLALVVFIGKLDVSRSLVAIAVPAAFALTVTARLVLRNWLHQQRLRGRYTEGVLVVGSAPAARSLIGHFQRAGVAEFSVLGVCVPTADVSMEVGGVTFPVLAGPDGACGAASACGARVIAVADARTLGARGLQRLARQIEAEDIELMAVPDVTDVAGPRISVSNAAGLPLLYVATPQIHGSRRLAKTVFERTAALAAIIVLFPFLLVVGLVVRLTSEGPAIFRQERVGLNGKRFRIWKYRTMVVDADARLPEVLHLNEFDDVLFKLKEDPRITPVGSVLRKWSLDELPQLWNVARGDMSLVGPRPPLASEVERYEEDAYRRLLVKPGITGLWQVSGRSSLNWEQSVQLDLHYIENWSLTMDLVVLARTVKAVALRKGAW
jgi:exopolysaccharide biosynthesis polyprenyl glycosylphosphotransferase